MKQNLLKVFALVCAMFVNASAWADAKPTLSMASFEIEPGKSYTATIELNQDGLTLKAVACVFSLSEGLTMASPKAVSGTMTDDDEEPTEPGVSFNKNNGKLALLSTSGYLFNSDAKEVMTVKFTAAEDFQGGTITLSGISFTDANNNEYQADNLVVNVTTPAPVVTGPAVTLVLDNKRIGMGLTDQDLPEKVGGQIFLNQDQLRIKAVSFKVALPEWLTMTTPKAVTETMTDDDEEPTEPGVSYNKQNGMVAIMSTSGYLFNESADPMAIATITFKPTTETEKLPTENVYDQTIKLYEIMIVDENNNEYNLPDFEAPIFYKVGIEDILDNSTSNDIYTVTGTRVNNMTRGLYIVNGKKVVVK